MRALGVGALVIAMVVASGGICGCSDEGQSPIVVSYDTDGNAILNGRSMPHDRMLAELRELAKDNPGRWVILDLRPWEAVYGDLGAPAQSVVRQGWVDKSRQIREIGFENVSMRLPPAALAFAGRLEEAPFEEPETPDRPQRELTLRELARVLTQPRSTEEQRRGVISTLIDREATYCRELLKQRARARGPAAEWLAIEADEFHRQLEIVTDLGRLKRKGRETMRTALNAWPKLLMHLASHEEELRLSATKKLCYLEGASHLGPIFARALGDPSWKVREIVLEAAREWDPLPSAVTRAIVQMACRPGAMDEPHMVLRQEARRGEYRKHELLKKAPEVLANARSEDLIEPMLRIVRPGDGAWKRLRRWQPTIEHMRSARMISRLERFLDDRKERREQLPGEGGSAVSDLALYLILRMTGQSPEEYGLEKLTVRHDEEVWGFAEAYQRPRAIARYRRWADRRRSREERDG